MNLESYHEQTSSLALALVISFSVPASSMPAPRFRAIPEVNMEAPGQRQLPPTEQRSQNPDTTGQVDDPNGKPCRFSHSNNNTCSNPFLYGPRLEIQS
jgi:hypothetical protein